MTMTLDRGLRALNYHGLSPSGALWLSHARSNPGQTMREGCAALGVSTAGGGQVLFRLEGMGLVAMRRDRRDRRLVSVYITEAGLEKLAEIEGAFACTSR